MWAVKVCAASVAAVAFLTATIQAPSASADDGGTAIVYSETYLRYIAVAPSGWASNACWLFDLLNGGGGVCTAEFDPVYFYPDGSLGSHPWAVDPASATGWSVPSPCTGVTMPADLDWWLLVEATNYPEYYPDAQLPSLTDDQFECGCWMWGWWW